MGASLEEVDIDQIDGEEWTIRDEAVRKYVREVVRRISSTVRSSLGPEAMETMVRTLNHQDVPETVITADADQIIAAIERGDGFNDPIAALFIDAVDSMQRSLGDGTATSMVLAEAFIHRGLDLIDSGIHPNTVVSGYAIAASHAGEVLDDLARECVPTDQDVLEHVARTSMTDTIPDGVRSQYATQVAEVVTGLAAATDGKWLDTEMVDVRATTDREQALYRGVVASRRPMPIEEHEQSHTAFDWTPDIDGVLDEATVAILNEEITIGETVTPTTNAQIASPEHYEREQAEYEQYRCEFARQVADMGVDLVVSQEQVDKPMQDALANAGVTVIDGVKYPKSDINRIAEATGGAVVSHSNDITPEVLGTAGRVREIVHDDEKWTIFEDCEGNAFTLILPVDLDASGRQRERMVSKAIEVTTVAAVDRQVLPGAGAPAAAIIQRWQQQQWSVPAREQLVVTEFTNALEDYLKLLAQNAGLDPIDTVTSLRSANATEEETTMGLNLETGRPIDPWEAGIIEPRRIFSQAIETARAIAEQLLTLDAILSPGVDFAQFTPEGEHE